MMRKTMAVAFCGVIAALCMVLMLLAGVVQIATIALPALAGMFLMAIVLELCAKWAWLTYAVVSVLSLLFVSDKEAALMFVLFFGYYPVLKATLDRIPRKWLCWGAKLLIFHAAMIANYLLAVTVLMVPQEDFMMFGVSIPLLLLLLGNVVFVLYDSALFGVVVLYCRRLQGKLHKFLH